MRTRHHLRHPLVAVALAAALASAAACGIPEEQHQKDLEAERQKTAAERRGRLGAEDKSTALAGERDRCLNGLEALGREKGQITGDLKAALDQLDAMRELAEKQRATISSITDSLQEMTSAGKLKVVQRRGRLIVEIAENILFASGASTLKEEGKAAIAELAPLLGQVEREFQITGHTDDVGTAHFNWTLSMARAYTVLKQMVKSGYPPENISAAGFAWFQPVASNETHEGKALNRRVELMLVPNLEDLNLPGTASAERLEQAAQACEALR